MHRVTANREQGNVFEKVFEIQARLSGLFYEKNNLTARFIPGRRPLIIKSELDYKLVNRLGCVGFFDCKSYADDHFDYSVIDPDQLKKSVHYNEWSVPSGFVVCLRSINFVVFYSGITIQTRGPRTRFRASDGLILGSFEKFDLKPLLYKNNAFFNSGIPPILSSESLK